MTHVTLSGALTMISTNGDGPQLLTEAAEFLNALAQLGVVMAVEINIKPATTYTPPVRIVEHAADSGEERATVSSPPFAPEPQGIAPAIEPTVQNEPNPQTPPLKQVGDSWRKMTTDQRRASALHFLANLHERLGHAPTQTEYHAAKPDWMPTATPLTALFGMSWADLVQKACPS